MARTKFTFEKRQRELARQQKQKDKAARRAEARQTKDEPAPTLQSDVSGAGDGSTDPSASAEIPAQGEEIPR
jgi:hypothetical protein